MKTYTYTYRNTAMDFLRFYLGNVYAQWTGIVNVIFAAAMLALMIARWNHTNILGKILMVLAFLLFPVIQPLVMLLRGKRSADAIKEDTTLILTEKGLEIRVLDHRQEIPWKKFLPVVRRPGLTVLRPDRTHAYFLPDRVTGKEAQEVLAFLQEKTGNGKS